MTAERISCIHIFTKLYTAYNSKKKIIPKRSHIYPFFYLKAAFQVSWPVVNDLCDYMVVILVLLAFDPKTPALMTYVQPHLGTDKCTS